MKNEREAEAEHVRMYSSGREINGRLIRTKYLAWIQVIQTRRERGEIGEGEGREERERKRRGRGERTVRKGALREGREIGREVQIRTGKGGIHHLGMMEQEMHVTG